ncbi:MAG: S8/S53 family peptidase [Acidobacteriaceae bacterium]|nr:S8/S53 family peptidase [Acidobacteriaceae bacterium]
MNRKKSFSVWYLAIVFGLAVPTNAQTTIQDSHVVADNTPRFISSAKDLGRADATQTIEVTVWLKPRHRAELDSLAEELYDPSSSRYHAWLKPADIVSRFAPKAEEVAVIGKFLSAHNLPVVSIGPANFSVRARGTLGDVEKAFHVEVHNFELNGETYRSNTSDPSIEGAAAALVASISGLDNLQYKHPVATVSGALNQQSSDGYQHAAAADPGAPFFTTNCFTGPATKTFAGTDTYGLSATATYTGNTYNGTHNSAGCGYTPPEIWTAYNLSGLYKEGFDGTGQTIVIIDWCGSPTIQDDANTFSATFGLPPLTSSNFHIYYSSVVPTCGAPSPEINLDVEWAHAIAPGANIALVVPPSASFMDVDDAQLYAIANGLGNVISGSYGSRERNTPIAVLNEENLLNQLAAVLGISANFSSGDSGDFTADNPASNPPTVNAPADSPYATAVGGVTLALNPDNTIAWQTGWGNNENFLVNPNLIYNPPTGFFRFGSGGGPSAFYAKPSFQNALPGTRRLLPDIAWLADPYTGGVIAITEPFVYPTEWEAVGGTSLAAPMFSALWAIANQEAGVPLGQAARYLYSMPGGTITDVLPVGSPTNVTGSVTDTFFGTRVFSAAFLAAPLEGTTTYYSAVWDYPLYQNTTYLLTFGTDTGLQTAPGWDNVTGLGTPNGQAFADYFNPARTAGVWGNGQSIGTPNGQASADYTKSAQK